MKVSVVISTYNGEKDIGILLDSIQRLETGSCELEVIIRDDCSSDGTVKIIEQEYGWVKLIPGREGNLGFVESNNIAFQQATGSVICCVNQDTILHPKFIVEGLKILRHSSQVFGVNSNMIMPWIMSVEQFKGKKTKDFHAYEYQLTPYGFIRYVEVEKKAYQTNFMTGGGFFIRRSVIPQDGNLFDPTIDMYCEDTELSLRLQHLGGHIMYCPDALIYHNQVSVKKAIVPALIKILHITRNRFALFARINSPLPFALKYPMYLAGILLKMSYLGFSFRKKLSAYVAGTGVAIFFFCLFPYWLLYSFYNISDLRK